MSNTGMRLVTMIEKKGEEYEVINFLPDIKIKHENEDDKTSKNFIVEEVEDYIKIPYAKGIDDLTVIVGENGVGKTRLVNDVGMKFYSVEDDEVKLLFVDSTSLRNSTWNKKIYSISDIDDIELKNPLEKLGNISEVIKISNAVEFDARDYIFKIEGLTKHNFHELDRSGRIFFKEYREQKFEDRDWDFTLSRELRDGETVDEIRVRQMANQINLLNASNKKILELLERFMDISNKKLRLFYNLSKVDFIYYSNEMRIDFADASLFLAVWSLRDILLNYVCYFKMKYFDTEDLAKERKILERIECELSKIEELSGYNSINIFPMELNKVYREYKERAESDSNNSQNILEDSSELDDLQKEPRVLEQLKDVYLFLKAKQTILSGEELTLKKIWKEFLKLNLLSVEEEFNNLLIEMDNFLNLSGEKSDVILDFTEIERFKEFNKEYSIREVAEISSFINRLETEQFSFNESSKSYTSYDKIKTILQAILPTWIGLSSGESALLDLFGRIYNASEKINSDNIILLLDEVDLGLHPEWQRKWVSVALPIIGEIFKDKHVQIIMTTHSPIMLSDIYKENVIFLEKDENGERRVRDNEKIASTFGQNIHDLYRDSFFLDSTRGEYADQKISSVITLLSGLLKSQEDSYIERYIFIERITKKNSEISEDSVLNLYKKYKAGASDKDYESLLNEIRQNPISHSDIDEKRMNLKEDLKRKFIDENNLEEVQLKGFIKKIIHAVGEPILRRKMQEMYYNISEFKDNRIKDLIELHGITKEEIKKYLREENKD